MILTRKHLHQLSDGFYLMYIPFHRYISICMIANDTIRPIQTIFTQTARFESYIEEDGAELCRSEVSRERQDVYKLTEEESGLFLIDHC